MAALVAVSLTAFSGYAALLAAAPAWAVEGGANEAGAGLVNGVLLAATVATQLFVPRLLRRFGTARCWWPSLVLIGVAAPGYALSDALVPVLAWSAVRGIGLRHRHRGRQHDRRPPRRARAGAGRPSASTGWPSPRRWSLLMPASVAVADRVRLRLGVRHRGAAAGRLARGRSPSAACVDRHPARLG